MLNGGFVIIKRLIDGIRRQPFPNVTWDKELVDVATARMVNRTAAFDTLVVANLHADILSDLAAALAGSLGIAPTGNIDPERRYPLMFDQIHGLAFDISEHRRSHPGRVRSPRHQRRAPGRLTGVASRRDRPTRQGLVSPRHYAFRFKEQPCQRCGATYRLGRGRRDIMIRRFL